MKYRISAGWQIFSYVFGSFIAVMGLFMAGKGFESAIQNHTFIAVFGLIFSLFGIVMIINTALTLVVLDDDQVTVTNIFGPRSLALNNIRGYGTGEKNLFYLIPVGGQKNLSIPPNLAGRDQLLSFFTGKYADVNAIQLEEATSHFLEDERFGATPEERATTLKRTARISMIMNYLPIVLLLLLSFTHQYYEPIMWVVFSIPWIVALLTRRMPGMISLLPQRNNPSPSFFLALVFTAMAAFIGTVPRFDFYDLGGKELGMFVVGGIIALALYSTICGDLFSQVGKKQLAYAGFAVLFCFYSAMLMLFTNCFYDRGAAQRFNTVVEDKHISHGKSDSYHLTLSAWGKFQDGKSFSVPIGLYTASGRGDSLQVNLFPGKWGIPWYRMQQEGTLITPLR